MSNPRTPQPAPPLIAPTIGRVVLYYPQGHHPSAQPFAAQVAYVHGDRCINIGFLNQNGDHGHATSVRLLDADEDLPIGPHGTVAENVCRWMPYQIGQARSSEASQSFGTGVSGGIPVDSAGNVVEVATEDHVGVGDAAAADSTNEA